MHTLPNIAALLWLSLYMYGFNQNKLVTHTSVIPAGLIHIASLAWGYSPLNYCTFDSVTGSNNIHVYILLRCYKKLFTKWVPRNKLWRFKDNDCFYAPFDLHCCTCSTKIFLSTKFHGLQYSLKSQKTKIQQALVSGKSIHLTKMNHNSDLCNVTFFFRLM